LSLVVIEIEFFLQEFRILLSTDPDIAREQEVAEGDDA